LPATNKRGGCSFTPQSPTPQAEQLTPQGYAARVSSLIETFAERGGPVAEQCTLVARWLDAFASWLLAGLLDTLAKTSALLQAVTRAPPPEPPHTAAMQDRAAVVTRTIAQIVPATRGAQSEIEAILREEFADHARQARMDTQLPDP
jgi:hypothetical protein